MSDHRDEFWDHMADVRAGMLGVSEDKRFVPMSHYVDTEANALWFITADGTDLVKDVSGAAKQATYVVASGGDGLYANISGRLSLEDNSQKLDELWNAIAASWFEDGKRDDDVRLLKLSITGAEVWATKGSLGFLYEVAKANLTGVKPDIGEHFSLTFPSV